MKWLAIKILEFRINKNKKKLETIDSSVIRSAYKMCIKSYETTVMYLNAEINKSKGSY